MRFDEALGRSSILLVTLLFGGGGALAQTNRPWTDPPADLNVPQPVEPQAPAAPPPLPVQPNPPQAAPSPEPAPPVQSAQPERPSPAPVTPPSQSAETPPAPPAAAPPAPAVAESPRRDEPQDRIAIRSEAARDLAVEYLRSWSAPNDETLEMTGDFYGDRVVFHGRAMSVKNLVREKRRFVRRWPERDYRPQPDTVKVSCEPAGMLCTVHAMFDFKAANPRRGRKAEGVGALQLVVSFVGERPVITAENSLVMGRNAARRNLALEKRSDD
ncbi:hypothetical protein ACFOYU_26530 [Microvirga sp. GCM10011540]|uniref:hypothetical protein n=1 Tax=Microvirga sp. GCM10011540 TaxID=3317338 RepID=UPI00360ED3BC